MRLAYADPPYIGCAHLYRGHPDYAGEVDHAALIERLESNFDGWVLHASATPTSIATLAPLVAKRDIRRGTYLAMIQRMLNAGLIKYTTKPNWRDSFYSIAPAGRAALEQEGSRANEQ